MSQSHSLQRVDKWDQRVVSGTAGNVETMLIGTGDGKDGGPSDNSHLDIVRRRPQNVYEFLHQGMIFVILPLGSHEKMTHPNLK